ncbi:MAG: amidase [Rhodospirillaceae bacterium]|nr:amidase [Rhodospirillaceae bacterium]
MEPYALTATEALSRIESGFLSATAWVESCLERIRLRDPEVRAWESVNQDVLDEVDARWRKDGRPSIPVGVKDIIDVRGQPTMMGTDFHDPGPKTRDGGSVAIMREAGCALIGKTVTTELGHLHPGPTRNPRNLGHTPGGSSSGSAAAVADQMVPLCLGTQTSGSVIRPASYCGVIGYKPTFNDFDKTGILANAPSIDTLGMFARSVDDIGLMRGILLEEPYQGIDEINLSDLRIGVLRSPPWETAETEVLDLVENFARDITDQGSQVVDLRLDREISRLLELHRLISGYEFRRSIAFERFHQFDRLSTVLREGRLADGQELDSRGYQNALQELTGLRSNLARAFQEVDVIATPSAASPAPRTLAATGSAAFNSAWSLAGNPVISLPLFNSRESGLPIGCQFIVGFAKDNLLLAASKEIMAAFEIT